MAIEALSWSLRIAAPSPVLERAEAPKERHDAHADSRREVFDAGSAKRLSYSVHDRASLSPGARISGPALIVEAQTTTVVTARFDAVIDNARNIILTRKATV